MIWLALNGVRSFFFRVGEKDSMSENVSEMGNALIGFINNIIISNLLVVICWY
jgi:hypothetical protein